MAVVRPQVVHFGTDNSRRRGCPSKRKSSYSYTVQAFDGAINFDRHQRRSPIYMSWDP